MNTGTHTKGRQTHHDSSQRNRGTRLPSARATLPSDDDLLGAPLSTLSKPRSPRTAFASRRIHREQILVEPVNQATGWLIIWTNPDQVPRWVALFLIALDVAALVKVVDDIEGCALRDHARDTGQFLPRPT